MAKPRSTTLETTVNGLWAALVLVVVFGAMVGVAPGYSWLNRVGWISHRANSPVQFDGNWMPGELRNCIGDEGFLDCTVYRSGEQHILSVEYWGRVDRGASSGWRCKLHDEILGGTDSLVCRAVN